MGPQDRRYLMLQGPHGPFFAQLARRLEATGGQVWRVGFNAGDRAFWGLRPNFIGYRGTTEVWPEACAGLIARHAITDLVLYGDTRARHAQAIRVARARGLRVHIFEEGYMRPWWITYERDGANGHSALMEIPTQAILNRAEPTAADLPEPPANWGDIREHIFYGALYHAALLAGIWRYPRYVTHRAPDVPREAWLALRRFALRPVLSLQRWWATRTVRRGGYPYHVALLQLDHDASFRAHGPFETSAQFIDTVVAAFARGAPPHHHLAFKEHPLDDGRAPLARLVRQAARAHGIARRTHYLRGGKLARLLDEAQSAVTVNSTAGQQALRRGLPLKTLGRAVYSRAPFVSDQPLEAFFAAPDPPDLAAYHIFRRYLLETSQIAGGFYAARARRRLMRAIVDRMLEARDPYAELSPPDTTSRASPRAARAQQLRVLRGSGG